MTKEQIEQEAALKMYRKVKNYDLRYRTKQKLLLQKAEKAGIKVSEAEIDLALKAK